MEGRKKHPAENTTEDKEQDKREEMDTERDVDEEETTKHSEARVVKYNLMMQPVWRERVRFLSHFLWKRLL